MSSQISLFDFGFNADGDFVNIELDKREKAKIPTEEYRKRLKEQDNELFRIIDRCFIDYDLDTQMVEPYAKEKINRIYETKCYHYGNFKNNLYILSLNDNGDYFLIFFTLKHYLAYHCTNYYIKNGEAIYYTLEDYLEGKTTISFPALYCPCFDKKGNKIEKYADGDRYKEDIRHIVCIDERKMNEFSINRIEKGKKITQFYEAEFTIPDLIEYWGEDN